MAVKPIPDGYNTVTPYLVVENASAVLEFVKKAFGANERMVMRGPDNTIGHAEVTIGDSTIMIADAGGENAPMPGMIHLYVEDCDAAYERALEAGATSIRKPEDQFYGDRSAGVRDQAGNLWWMATHLEDVSQEEMARRSKERAES